MLVGVELLVVQLHGDEPRDSCDDLQTTTLTYADHSEPVPHGSAHACGTKLWS